MAIYPKYKAAAVQAAPVYLNLQATLEKSIKFIDEAGAKGAKLIGFPEGFLPGYPVFAMMDGIFNTQKWYHKLYKNAVEIPSPAIEKISQAAKRNAMYVCISCSEKENGSLYLTQLWFNPKGDFIGKHRKMRCTFHERVIWGDGQGCMMPVFETELGNLGGCQCWEHLVPMILTAMNSQNEQVHIAAWPGADYLEDDTAIASRYYALSTGTFVLQCPSIYSDELKNMLIETEAHRAFFNTPQFKSNVCCIYGPDGLPITELLPGEVEGIVYGEIDLEKIIDHKFLIDPTGHYANT